MILAKCITTCYCNKISKAAGLWLATHQKLNKSHITNSQTLCTHVLQLKGLLRIKESELTLGLQSVNLFHPSSTFTA